MMKPTKNTPRCVTSRPGLSRYPCLAALLALTLLAGCGGGSGASDEGVGNVPDQGCSGFCANADSFLTADEVRLVIAQAVHEAGARGAPATVAVVDRVGNVLGVFQMAGANNEQSFSSPTGDVTVVSNVVTVTSGRDPLVQGGLENLAVIPDTAAAISKAITAAFLSSEGNAFTPRTANQIVQEHFNPGEFDQPGGPLFGVQFSSLACSDFNARAIGADVGAGPGPQRSPLGLSADPGGLPLYKDGTPVGAIGVIADGIYGVDANIGDFDSDVDEIIAVAGTFGFAAPVERRADRITVDGKIFRFSDADFSDLSSDPAPAPALDSIDMAVGQLVAVNGYIDNNVRAGTAFGQPESGIVPADPALFPAELDAFMLVDANGNNRFAPRDGLLMAANEVQVLLRNAVASANRTRAQIRQPASTPMRASVSVVDVNGDILGILRTRDAPVFGLDVSLQKARTAAFFSSADAAAGLQGAADALYFPPDAGLITMQQPQPQSIGAYVDRARQFLGSPTALADGAIAFSDRANGNLSRPFFPDGITNNPPGPFSKPFAAWSPFSTGLQLDLIVNQVASHVLFIAGFADTDVAQDCTAVTGLANGVQIFPGSVPIYKNGQLAGGIGISGDGIDQDDMTAFLGLHNAGLELGGSISNAPEAIRADRVRVPGFNTNLRYIQCPQGPFLDSNEQNPCQGK